MYAEIDSINNLTTQREKSSEVKSSFQKLQDAKTKTDRTYEIICDLLKPEARQGLSEIEKEFKGLSVKIQKATTDSVNYVDCSIKKIPWNLPMTSDGLEDNNSRKDNPLTSNDDEDGQTRSFRQSADNTLDKSLKLLRDVNQSTVFEKRYNRMAVAPRQTGSATMSTVKGRS